MQYNFIHINECIIISLNFHIKMSAQPELYLACIQEVHISSLGRSNGCMEVSAWFSFPVESVVILNCPNKKA